MLGTSLVVKGEDTASTHGVWVRSMVGELRSHMLQPKEKSDAYVILRSMKSATNSITSYKQFTYLNLKILYSIAKKCYASSESSVSHNLFLVES